MKFIDASGVEFACPVSFSGSTGTLDLNSATSNNFVVKRYVSQQITQAALSAGASCTVALTGEPVAMIPLAIYCRTTATTTSGNAGTTGLAVEIGISGDDNFLMESTSVFGAASRKEAYAGVGMGGYRAADALLAKFTATGGGADCAHISALSLYVVLYYIEVASET